MIESTRGCFLTLTTVDSVADWVIDPADLVDSVVDLIHPADLPVDLGPVLRSAEAFLFTISVFCAVKCLDDGNLCLGSSSGK